MLLRLRLNIFEQAKAHQYIANYFNAIKPSTHLHPHTYLSA